MLLAGGQTREANVYPATPFSHFHNDPVTVKTPPVSASFWFPLRAFSILSIQRYSNEFMPSLDTIGAMVGPDIIIITHHQAADEESVSDWLCLAALVLSYFAPMQSALVTESAILFLT